MIAFALSLALAQPASPAPAECGRWGGADLRACEVDRSEHDVLDAAGSAPMRELGDGGIRFSSMPELGGDAFVVEFRPNRRGGARARFTWLYGHLRWRWIREGRWTFDLTPAAFREFSAVVDDAMSRIRPDPGPADPDAPETRFFCMDGPGFLTERVRDGRVFTMTGFCPYSAEEDHPHRAVNARVLDMICPRFRAEFNPRDGIGAACVRRDRRLRSARR